MIFSTHNMASVEEICDHITLINKSHNILSGPIDEVRRSMGTGRYRLCFEGDGAALAAAVANVATVEQATEGEMLLRLANGATQRDLITIANHAVTLRSFAEEIPTMNDIFIHTVNNYNNGNKQ